MSAVVLGMLRIVASAFLFAQGGERRSRLCPWTQQAHALAVPLS